MHRTPSIERIAPKLSRPPLDLLPMPGSRKIKGLFTALITPFDEEGGVDVERLASLVKFQLSKGTEGIFPCGSTGLGPMLRVEERKIVAEAVVGAAGGAVPVVVQVGCADTTSTVELAKYAEKVGADAVASLTPYYYKPGERAVIRHFEAVADAVEVPVFAYNIPQFTGNNLSPKTVALLASKGTIDGVKDSSRDLLQLLDLLDTVREGFVVMNGTEEYGLFAMMAGADGLISGAANALPEVFKPLVVALRNNDYEGAMAAQKAVLKVKELVKAGPISAYYEILRARGMDCGVPRPPFLPLEESERERVFSGLRAMQLI
jgi:4-hydroxy-tetrahydrodipicolinate synthase